MSKMLFNIGRASLSVAMTLVTLGIPAVVQAQTLRPSTTLAQPPVTDSQTVRPADYIVAIVGGDPITNNEVRARLLRLEIQLLNLGAETPPREEMLPEVVERLISERAQVQRAKEMGVSVDEGSVTQAITDLTSDTSGSGAVASQLRQQGVSEEQLRVLLRDELILARLREQQIRSVQVSNAELDAYIAEQESASGLQGPEVVNLAQVLVPVPESADASQKQALRQKAETIRTQALSGTSLKELAASNGLDDSAASGSGFRALQDFPEIFASATAQLPTGSVSQVIESGAGFHVLKVLQRKQAKGGAAGPAIVQTNAKHILIRPGQGKTNEEVVEILGKLRSHIAKGEISFEAAAKEYSQDGSAANGGDLGWASPNDFVPEFELEMNLLAPGQISQPFITRYGVHLMKVVKRRTKVLDNREKRQLSLGAFKEKKGQEQLIKWARDVRAQAYVEKRRAPTL